MILKLADENLFLRFDGKGVPVFYTLTDICWLRRNTIKNDDWKITISSNLIFMVQWIKRYITGNKVSKTCQIIYVIKDWKFIK